MILPEKKYLGFKKRAALFLTAIMLFETIFPTASMALTSGPASPEFSSFEPVATTNMVNEFSGDFTYNIPVINIPGADGGGYALSLSYHSGETLESEASWVGYGWTLNPGAINRSKRGFADDSKAVHTFHNDVPKNWTASVGTSIGDPELFSVDIPISLNAGLRYNNYKGFGYTAGIGLSVKGIVSIGYSVSDGSGSFSAQVNPAALLSSGKQKKEKKEKEKQYYEHGRKEAKGWTNKKQPPAKPASEQEAKDAKTEKRKSQAAKVLGPLGNALSSYGMHTFGDLQMPTSITPYTAKSFNVSLNLDLDPGPVPIGLTMGLSGNYTEQTNVASKDRTCYGYLYSSTAHNVGEEESMMDYYTEKDSPFNKRDRYMSIPFSNADLYSVTGEGLSGGFRLHQKNIGLFRPNNMSSQTQIFQAALEFNVGLTIGAGLDVGVGLQTISYFGNRWGSGTGTANAFTQYNFQDISTDKENCFFRFSNDMGGDVDYGSDALVTALVNSKSPDISSTTSGYINSQPNTLASTIDNGGTPIARSGRSSYIAYNTFADLRSLANGKRINAYDNSFSTNNLRPTSGKDEQIGEIATVNEEGNTYVYGLTANSQSEKNISYSMEGGTVTNKFLGYKSVSGSNKMKVGTETASDYVTTYLLTQITTPDYVDRTLNGPTEDDFGGYTKFVYKKVHTNYHWRMPYTGLSYSKGDQSNPGDDMGSFSSGNKEIYYLDSIITKTHRAKFYTNVRTDGVEAAPDMSAASNAAAKGTQQLYKLDSICLYTNNNGIVGKLVKKTCFKYSNSLCNNVPNSTATGAGKLTLESVWFEYEGIVPAKISPYVFSYNYVDPMTTYPFPYSTVGNPNVFNDYANIIAAPASAQNPTYNVCDIDAWGNYQKSGAARFDLSKQNVNQNPASDFDPAAWQLKRITLPSGGEIHVQYEQDDYQYVQNRRAMALVSLDPSDPSTPATSNTFTLNIDADLGPYTDAEKQDMVDLINSELNNDKIYFKFLYTLIGSAVPDLTTCNADYITGYVDFGSATLTGPSGSKKIVITLATAGSGAYHLPNDICVDLVKKEKGGKIDPGGNCDPSESIDDGGSAVDIVSQLVNKMGTIFTPGNLCLSVNPSLSYLKVPLLKAKKGGGLRVKRILMYDGDGVDDGQAALYGTEYIYKLENGQSSGVATNEPATIREENPLINFIPKRTDQTFLNKAISGTDKEQFEGPLGESILPGPSVGYSRVVSKNIHDGKTNTGFVVSEFYTDKDYPFDMVYGDGVTPGINGSGVSNTTINDQTFDKFWLNIPAVFVNISNNNIWSSQGYRFIKNNMNGQPKSVSTYGGDYLPGAPTLANKSSSTEYAYFLPGQKIPVLKDDGTTELKDIGKETEVVMEARGVEDITEDINTEFDASMGITPPIIYIPYFSGSGSLSYAESKMYTHVTSKVISFPAIQKSITQTQDGISHKTENLVFSRYTGKPVQTRSYDGFDAKDLQQSIAHKGMYTSFEVQGYTQYSALGQKAINQDFKFTSGPDYTINFSTSPYTLTFSLTPGGNPSALCNSLGALTVGDLISVTFGSTVYYFHIDGISGTAVSVIPSGNFNSTGTTYSALTGVNLKVIKSGKTNQLSTNIGSYTVYGDVSTATVSTSNMAARIAFVSTLNGLLTDAMTGVGSTTTSLNSSNIDFSNSMGGCQHAPEHDYAVGLISSPGLGANRFSIRVYSDLLINNQTCTNQDNYLVYPGHFIIDNVTSKIKYIQDALPCVQYDVSCLQFCTPGGSGTAVNNVIASAATTMDYIWPYSATLFDLGNLNAGKNDYETGVKGKWRPASSYTYKESIIGGAIENGTTHERIYNAGTYTMTSFNWKNPAITDTGKWVRTSTITKYSPNGSGIEEKDASYIYSAAKYGYQQMLPYLIAHNSTYSSANFESFENTYTSTSGNVLEENLPVNTASITTLYAHAGKSSYMLGTTSFTFAQSVLTSQMTGAGVSCKIWVKDPQHAALPIKGNVNNIAPLVFNKIAQTGEWTLYEAKVTSWTGISSPLNFAVSNNITSQPVIYIDDVRMQPLDAQVNAYVYDKVTKRLLTSFDDQHFGLYYQYNREGKLVRKLIETEKGIKTIAETQYNSPKVAR